MTDKIDKIDKVAGWMIITLLVLSFGVFFAVLGPDSFQEKTRFEALLPATTMDNIELEVRLFGFYSTNVWADKHGFLEIFQHEIRDEFKSINHKDIPKKVKSMFLDTLRILEDAGVDFDSISQSRKDNE